MSEIVVAQEPILQILSSVGVSGLTGLMAWLWIRKDKQYTELADRLAGAFEKHAESNTKLTSAVYINTKATEKLDSTITTKLFEILKSRSN